MHTSTQSTELLFEISRARPALPSAAGCDVPATPLERAAPARARCADAPPPLPEVGEIDLVRHFTNLSTRNMSIDTNFYPLGSCTMKYNPKRHERLAALPGFADLHPLQDDDIVPGHAANCSSRCSSILAEIAGLPAVSLQPAAGAQGELTALLVAAAYFRDKGETHAQGPRPRQRPRHQPRQRRPRRLRGRHRQEQRRRGSSTSTTCKAKLDDETAVFMITNPNTLGLFEPQIDDDHRAAARRAAASSTSTART